MFYQHFPLQAIFYEQRLVCEGEAPKKQEVQQSEEIEVKTIIDSHVFRDTVLNGANGLKAWAEKQLTDKKTGKVDQSKLSTLKIDIGNKIYALLKQHKELRKALYDVTKDKKEKYIKTAKWGLNEIKKMIKDEYKNEKIEEYVEKRKAEFKKSGRQIINNILESKPEDFGDRLSFGYLKDRYEDKGRPGRLDIKRVKEELKGKLDADGLFMLRFLIKADTGTGFRRSIDTLGKEERAQFMRIVGSKAKYLTGVISEEDKQSGSLESALRIEAIYRLNYLGRRDKLPDWYMKEVQKIRVRENFKGGYSDPAKYFQELLTAETLRFMALFGAATSIVNIMASKQDFAENPYVWIGAIVAGTGGMAFYHGGFEQMIHSLGKDYKLRKLRGQIDGLDITGKDEDHFEWLRKNYRKEVKQYYEMMNMRESEGQGEGKEKTYKGHALTAIRENDFDKFVQIEGIYRKNPGDRSNIRNRWQLYKRLYNKEWSYHKNDKYQENFVKLLEMKAAFTLKQKPKLFRTKTVVETEKIKTPKEAKKVIAKKPGAKKVVAKSPGIKKAMKIEKEPTDADINECIKNSLKILSEGNSVKTRSHLQNLVKTRSRLAGKVFDRFWKTKGSNSQMETRLWLELACAMENVGNKNVLYTPPKSSADTRTVDEVIKALATTNNSKLPKAFIGAEGASILSRTRVSGKVGIKQDLAKIFENVNKPAVKNILTEYTNQIDRDVSHESKINPKLEEEMVRFAIQILESKIETDPTKVPAIFESYLEKFFELPNPKRAMENLKKVFSYQGNIPQALKIIGNFEQRLNTYTALKKDPTKCVAYITTNIRPFNETTKENAKTTLKRIAEVLRQTKILDNKGKLNAFFKELVAKEKDAALIMHKELSENWDDQEKDYIGFRLLLALSNQLGDGKLSKVLKKYHLFSSGKSRYKTKSVLKDGNVKVEGIEWNAHTVLEELAYYAKGNERLVKFQIDQTEARDTHQMHMKGLLEYVKGVKNSGSELSRITENLMYMYSSEEDFPRTLLIALSCVNKLSKDERVIAIKNIWEKINEGDFIKECIRLKIGATEEDEKMIKKNVQIARVLVQRFIKNMNEKPEKAREAKNKLFSEIKTDRRACNGILQTKVNMPGEDAGQDTLAVVYISTGLATGDTPVQYGRNKAAVQEMLQYDIPSYENAAKMILDAYGKIQKYDGNEYEKTYTLSNDEKKIHVYLNSQVSRLKLMAGKAKIAIGRCKQYRKWAEDKYKIEIKKASQLAPKTGPKKTVVESKEEKENKTFENATSNIIQIDGRFLKKQLLGQINNQALQVLKKYTGKKDLFNQITSIYPKLKNPKNWLNSLKEKINDDNELSKEKKKEAVNIINVKLKELEVRAKRPAAKTAEKKETAQPTKTKYTKAFKEYMAKNILTVTPESRTLTFYGRDGVQREWKGYDVEPYSKEITFDIHDLAKKEIKLTYISAYEKTKDEIIVRLDEKYNNTDKNRNNYIEHIRYTKQGDGKWGKGKKIVERLTEKKVEVKGTKETKTIYTEAFQKNKGALNVTVMPKSRTLTFNGSDDVEYSWGYDGEPYSKEITFDVNDTAKREIKLTYISADEKIKDEIIVSLDENFKNTARDNYVEHIQYTKQANGSWGNRRELVKRPVEKKEVSQLPEVPEKDQINFGSIKIGMRPIEQIYKVNYKKKMGEGEYKKLRQTNFYKTFSKAIKESAKYYEIAQIDGKKLRVENPVYVKSEMQRIFNNLKNSSNAKEMGLNSSSVFEKLNPSQAFLFINKLVSKIIKYDRAAIAGGKIRSSHDSASIDYFFKNADKPNGVCRQFAALVSELFKHYKENIVSDSNKEYFKDVHVIMACGEVKSTANYNVGTLGDGSGHAWNMLVDLQRKHIFLSDITWNDTKNSFEIGKRNEATDIDAKDVLHMNRSALIGYLIWHAEEIPASMELAKSYISNLDLTHKNQFLLELADTFHSVDRFNLAEKLYTHLKGKITLGSRLKAVQKNREHYERKNSYGSTHKEKDKKIYKKVKSLFGIN